MNSEYEVEKFCDRLLESYMSTNDDVNSFISRCLSALSDGFYRDMVCIFDMYASSYYVKRQLNNVLSKKNKEDVEFIYIDRFIQDEEELKKFIEKKVKPTNANLYVVDFSISFTKVNDAIYHYIDNTIQMLKILCKQISSKRKKKCVFNLSIINDDCEDLIDELTSRFFVNMKIYNDSLKINEKYAKKYYQFIDKITKPQNTLNSLLNDVDFEKTNSFGKITNISRVFKDLCYDSAVILFYNNEKILNNFKQTYNSVFHFKSLNTANVNVDSLKTFCCKNIIGQDESIEKICQRLESRILFGTSERILMTAMLAGSTGVGKTETVKIIAEYLKKYDYDFYTYDMSTYSSGMNVASLFGAAPGYVGYSEGGALINDLANNNRAVILFDEIEKADTLVLNSLLKMLDEGFIKTHTGDTITLDKCLIFMTTNSGSKESKIKSVGFNNKGTDKSKVYNKAISGDFRPEFLSRLDEVLIFNDLSESDYRKIINLQFKRIKKKIKDKYSININLDTYYKDKILKQISENGSNVRSVKRMLEQAVMTKLKNLQK